MKSTVGFVGLGLMGSAMAERFMQHGLTLVIHNRTRQKAEFFLKAGAAWADSPGMAAERSGVVFSMLSTSDVLNEVATGTRGILKGLSNGGIHVDCSTVAPSLTKQLADLYASEGKIFLHCPVLGSIPQVRDGVLLLLMGGEAHAIERVEPFVKILGNRIWKFERVEQASHAKLMCNLFIAGAITTLGQALVFAEKVDVSRETLLDIIANSALNSQTYQTKGKSILEKNFAPRFYTEHMLKDVNLMIEAARAAGITLPAVEVTRQLLAKAVELGYGKEDYSSIVKVLAQS